MTMKSDPVPMKDLNDLDRQAKASQLDGKPFRPSPYLVRCIVTELKAFRRIPPNPEMLTASERRPLKTSTRIRTEARVTGDRKH